jgi:thiosulfate/3-mercaptopyruvate sulfurtransferase
MSPHNSRIRHLLSRLSALAVATLMIAAVAMPVAVRPASAQAAAPQASSDVSALVSPQWLKAKLGDPAVVVLDIRSALGGGGKEGYLKGHIAGAIYSDYDKAGWRVERGGVPFMLPTKAELEKLIGELGIDEDDHVVVVPAGVSFTDFGAAARVYWTLKVAGLKNASILDGGYQAWTADPSNPVETGNKTPSPKIFTAKINDQIRIEVGEVEKLVEKGGATLVDARPASYFAGKEKAPASKAYGRLPGAVSFDSADFYDKATNRLKPKPELEKVAANIPAGPTVSYCNTGHWASTDWFVLSEVLGRKDVKLFAGSMVEWTSDANRPLASSRTKWDDLKKALGLGT